MTLREAGREDLPYVRALYEESFPPEERKPFRIITRWVRRGSAHIFVLDDGGPCAMAVTMEVPGVTLLDYLAVDPARRGEGLGGLVLDELSARFAQGVFFLEIERQDDGAPNAEQRRRRRQFYLQHGMTATNVFIRLFGVEMEILSYARPASFEQCDALYRVIYKTLYRHVIKRIK